MRLLRPRRLPAKGTLRRAAGTIVVVQAGLGVALLLWSFWGGETTIESSMPFSGPFRRSLPISLIPLLIAVKVLAGVLVGHRGWTNLPKRPRRAALQLVSTAASGIGLAVVNPVLAVVPVAMLAIGLTFLTTGWSQPSASSAMARRIEPAA